MTQRIGGFSTTMCYINRHYLSICLRVTLNMPSAAEECREPWGKCRGISHCLESDHPEWHPCPIQAGLKPLGTTLDTPLTLIFLDRLSHHNFRWRQIRTHSVQSTVGSSRRPGLRSADTADYIKRRTRTKFGERCFSHAGPAAWNSLPDSIRLTTDANRLKNLLKTHLIW